MRQYILHVVHRNLRRMRKHKLVTEAAFKKFRLPEGSVEKED